MRSTVLLSALLAFGCGPGSVAQEIASPSPAPNAADALGEDAPVCSGQPQIARPLVLDGSSQLRTDLELAMREGVVVVRYDCASLEVLPRCSLPGSYAFAGVSRKEEVVRLGNADEIVANLPLGIASLRGKLRRSEALDLAMVMVGRQSTAHSGLIKRADPLGQGCDGATHFVRAAFVGAFALNRSRAGEVASAAEVFGAGAEASSSTREQTLSRDGDIEACRASSSDASAPPVECGSMLRLDLWPLASQRGSGELVPKAPGCPDGFVRVGERCIEDAALAHVCPPDDEAECDKQCKAGDMPSCYNLGRIHHDPPQTGLTPNPRTKALGLYRKACDGGVQAACVGLGDIIIGDSQRRNRPPLAVALNEAIPLYEQACAAGVGRGCARQAWIYSSGGMRADPPKALRLAQRACDLGSGTGCSLLATELVAKREVEAAYRAYMKGCEGGDQYGCNRVAKLYFHGSDDVHNIAGVEPKLELAERAARRSCRMDAARCAGISTFVKFGKERLDKWIRNIACEEGAESFCSQ